MSLGTRFEQFENLFFSPELDFSLEDLQTTSAASTNLKKQAGNYEDFYFNYGLDYDLRNSPLHIVLGTSVFSAVNSKASVMLLINILKIS